MDLFKPKKNRIGNVGVQDIQFVGEQSGTAENELKQQLNKVLAKYPAVRTSYLSQVIYEPGSSPAVALCLAGATADQKLLKDINNIFAIMFNKQQYLDIIFVNEIQEIKLREVCHPFYCRKSV